MPPSLQVLVDLGYQPSSGGNHLVFRCPSAGSGPRAESRGPSSPRATEPGDLKNLESTGDYYYARIKDILNVGTVTSQTGGKKAVNVGAVPIVWEKSAFHAADKVNVLFLDLHVDQIDIPKLEELVKANSASYASPPKLPTAAPTPTPAVAPSPGQ
jgi:prepilin-type processing-associated H-X9-DG protein